MPSKANLSKERRLEVVKILREGAKTGMTRQEALEACGITHNTLLRYLKKHGITLARGYSGKMQVCVRGVIYPTVQDAAAAHGVSPATVYGLVERGRADQIGTGRGRSSRKGKVTICKPITIGGHHFASRADLARKIGVERRYISSALSRDSGPMKEAIIARVMDWAAKNAAKQH